VQPASWLQEGPLLMSHSFTCLIGILCRASSSRPAH